MAPQINEHQPLLDKLYPLKAGETLTNSCKGKERKAFMDGVKHMDEELKKYKELYFKELVTQQKAEKNP